jgi:hypothetical protein
VWIAAAIGVALQPVHVAVRTAVEEVPQPRRGPGYGVRPGDAERVEPLRPCRGRERGLYGGAVLDQKSRLA